MLDIIGKRADGYHEIATVMHSVDLADDVVVRSAEPGIRLSTSGIPSPEGSENIAFRAAERSCEAFGVEPAVEIDLHKRIPSEAGLAGGSADAAGVLLGLSALHGWSAGDERLASVARELGADIPFFLGEGAGLAEGIGERLTPLPSADIPVVLALCKLGVSTGWAYANVGPEHYMDGTRASRAALELLRRGTISEVGNAFVPALAPDRPDLTEMIARLQELTGGLAGMTGSGACCFALPASQADARAAAEKLASAGFWSWAGRSATRPVTIEGRDCGA